MSTDGGNTFGTITNLSNNTGNSEFPQIDSAGKKILIVWQDNSTGNNEINLRVSTDGGNTFGTITNLSNSTGNSAFPQIDSAGKKILIVWQDNSTGNNEINLRESTDGGNTFIDLKNMSRSNIQYDDPKVLDSDLKVERVASGIKFPTQMAFLDQNDILVLEKNDGEVKRVINGSILNDPLLDVPVANGVERGMLGIAIQKENSGPIYVYLYFTESVKDGDDVSEGKLPRKPIV